MIMLIFFLLTIFYIFNNQYQPFKNIKFIKLFKESQIIIMLSIIIGSTIIYSEEETFIKNE